jgi:transmembrane sensor
MTTDAPSDRESVQAVKERAIEWLERSERRNFAQSDRERLEQWLSESAGHRIAFWHAKSAWERAGRLRILKPPVPAARKSPSRLRIALAACAAVALVAVASGMGTAWFAGPRERVLSTGQGERETVSLADGSKIELNTDTELHIGSGKDRRTARLVKGEAYFQIVHDAAHPFTVVAGKHSILDLGTKFSVRQSRDGLRVALVEGSARIVDNAGGEQHPVTLKPGDVALAGKGGISVARKPVRDLADDLAWRHGGLVFHNATLGEAVEQFNRYAKVKLVVSDPRVAGLTINGAFRATGTQEFAGVAHEIFGLHVERRENEIQLSR